MNRYRRLLSYQTVALPLILVASLVFFSTALGHEIEIVRSDPAAEAVLQQSPPRVTIWFNVELQTKISTIKVYDANSKQVDNKDGGVDLNDPDHASMTASLPPSLPDGVYIVRWHAVLPDEDAGEGEYKFYVGEKSDLPTGQATSNLDSTGDAVSDSAWLLIGLGGVLAIVGGVALLLRRRTTWHKG